MNRPLVFAVAAAGFGILQIGGGLYTFGKAHLAQYLLQRAWSESLVAGASVRPWPWADTWPVAKLRILEIELIVLAGGFGEALAFGPGWLMASAEPGKDGITVIAGHRDTHFGVLSDVPPGHLIWLETSTGERFEYRVNRSVVVDSRSWRISTDAPGQRLLLVTCYPFDSVNPGGPLRFVVEAVAHLSRSEVLAQNSQPRTIGMPRQ